MQHKLRLIFVQLNYQLINHGLRMNLFEEEILNMRTKITLLDLAPSFNNSHWLLNVKKTVSFHEQIIIIIAAWKIIFRVEFNWKHFIFTNLDPGNFYLGTRGRNYWFFLIDKSFEIEKTVNWFILQVWLHSVPRNTMKTCNVLLEKNSCIKKKLRPVN